MAISSDDAESYVEFLVDLFFPLIAAIENPDEALGLLVELGYAPPDAVTAFATLSPAFDKLQDLIDTLEQAAEANDSDKLLAALLDLLRLAASVFQGGNAFAAAIQNNFAGPGLLTDTDILAAIVAQRADYLVIRF